MKVKWRDVEIKLTQKNQFQFHLAVHRLPVCAFAQDVQLYGAPDRQRGIDVVIERSSLA